jgi:ribosomal protein S18 acetylase RimI-like enzyme
MTNGDARREHSKRPLSERLHDEKTLETLTKDVKEWMSDQKKYDMLRVDDPTPLKFSRVEFPQKTGLILGDIKARDKHGNEVGYISYARNECDMHLSMIHVRTEYVGKGYGAYLMREFVNMIDKNCLQSTLEVVPFGIVGREEVDEEAYDKQEEVLRKFYSSFGYDEMMPSIMVRKPVCEGKSLKPECETVDLSLLVKLVEELD